MKYSRGQCILLLKRTSMSVNEVWTANLEKSEFRVQWDPDHDPKGGKLERSPSIRIKRPNSATICYKPDCRD